MAKKIKILMDSIQLARPVADSDTITVRSDRNTKEMTNVEFRNTFNELSSLRQGGVIHRMFIDDEYAGYLKDQGPRTSDGVNVMTFHNGDYFWYMPSYAEMETFLTSAQWRRCVMQDYSRSLLMSRYASVIGDRQFQLCMNKGQA